MPSYTTAYGRKYWRRGKGHVNPKAMYKRKGPNHPLRFTSAPPTGSRKMMTTHRARILTDQREGMVTFWFPFHDAIWVTGVKIVTWWDGVLDGDIHMNWVVWGGQGQYTNCHGVVPEQGKAAPLERAVAVVSASIFSDGKNLKRSSPGKKFENRISL